MKNTNKQFTFNTNMKSIQSESIDNLQKDLLQASYIDNKNQRERCNELEAFNLKLVNDNINLKDTINKMQQSAGKTVGLANKK